MTTRSLARFFTGASTAQIILACGNAPVVDDKRGYVGDVDTVASETSSDSETPTLNLDGNDLSIGEDGRPRFMKFGSSGQDLSWDGRFALSVESVRVGSSNATQISVKTLQPLQMTARLFGNVPVWSDALVATWANGLAARSDLSLKHAAIGQNPRVTTPHNANPYRCKLNVNAATPTFPTTYEPAGQHLCYEAIVYSAAPVSGNKRMSSYPMRIVIAAYKADGSAREYPVPIYAKVTADPVPLQYLDSDGVYKTMNIWEPSTTVESRLLFMQDRFTYNFTPNLDPRGWSKPENVGKLHLIGDNVSFANRTFKEMYPIAREPMLDALGNPCYDAATARSDCGGAYPWISRDGSELFFAGVPNTVPASQDGGCDADGPSKSPSAGTSVIGVRTHFKEKMIDGNSNVNRLSFNAASRALGIFGTMWTPFPEIGTWALPYTNSKYVYGLITGGTYGEVGFDDYQDGQYIVHLAMNELRGRTAQIGNGQTNYLLNTFGRFTGDEADENSDLDCIKTHNLYGGAADVGDATKSAYIASPSAVTISQTLTPDTSGNFHNAELAAGAYFPQEYFRLHPEISRGTATNTDQDVGEAIGYIGRAVYMSPRGSVRIHARAVASTLQVGNQTVTNRYNANGNFARLNADLPTATVELAVKMPGSAPRQTFNLASRAGAWQLLRRSDGTVQVKIYDNSTTPAMESVVQTPVPRAGTTPTPPTLSEADRWYHVAFTFHQKLRRVQIYIDGELVQTGTLPTNAKLRGGTSDIVIGPAMASGSTTDAMVIMDEFAFSNVVRTKLELARRAYRSVNVTSVKVPTAADLQANGLHVPTGFAASQMRVPNGVNALLKNRKFAAAAQLGEKIFNDKTLTNNDIACSTCHDPSKHFVDARLSGRERLRTSIGVNNQVGPRNSPTILNRAFSIKQFADGRSGDLALQVLEPITNPIEMAGDLDAVLANLSLPTSKYHADFNSIFGNQTPMVDANRLATVLSAFIDSKIRGASIVDRLVVGELTDEQQAESNRANLDAILRGRAVFEGKGQCLSCHRGPNFTDELFHNTGTATPADRGRAAVTGRLADLGAFKTPTLRAIRFTFPYFHDGGEATLMGVIDHYNEGERGARSPAANLSPEIRPLGLSPQEKQDLLIFLQQL